ncbi:MAG: choice-of-anchor E domain-containing protein [Acetobacteraceae bacterium]|nr:choice-of-anchor E domain-containing protein [Acetobacteraceae bacterium]
MTTLISQQQQTIAARPEGWSARLPFRQFDPSLGTLTGVRVSLDGTLAGSISLENLGSVASTISVRLPGTMDVSAVGLDLGVLTFNSNPAASVTLGAFDGVKDFAGSSGTVVSGVFSTGGTTGGLSDAPHLAQFTGLGTVDLSLTSDGSSEVSGNATLRDLLNINTGGVVTLEYQFIPPVILPGLGGGNSSAVVTYFFHNGALTGGGFSIFPSGGTIAVRQTTVAQILTLPDRITGWSTNVSVNKFDPSLGSLREVLVTIGNDLTGTASVENLDARGWRIGFDQYAAVFVTPPGTTVLAPAKVSDDSAILLNLGAYDGTMDFAGTSGTVVSFGTSDPLARITAGGGALTDAEDLAAFTGPGTIALPVGSTGRSAMIGPPNLLAEIAQSTGATISVRYVYSATPFDLIDYGSGFPLATSPGDVPSPTGAGPVGALPAFTASLPDPPCFAAGTRIATPKGAVAVERLREGDAVLTVSGGREPVHWIGHRNVDCRRHPSPDRVMPVRVAAHAFGNGRPERPVLLSPDHAVFVEDVLIPIKFLINGHTVSQIEVDTIAYYHLELPNHDVVLAEGLPVESYLETGGRGAFENADDPISLHPDFATGNDRVAAVWRQSGYAPLLGNDGQLHRARLKVLLQAQLLDGEAVNRRERPTRRTA